MHFLVNCPKSAKILTCAPVISGNAEGAKIAEGRQ